MPGRGLRIGYATKILTAVRGLFALTGQNTTLTYTPVGGSDPDWTARSAGAVKAVRLQTQGEIDAWAWADIGHISLDTTVKPTGATGSAKFAVLNSDQASSGQISFYFGDVATFGAGATGWVSYRIRAPIEAVYQAWSANGGPDHKLSIFSSRPSSSVANEIVIQANGSHGMLCAYAQDGSSYPPLNVGVSTACNGSDFNNQNSVDRALAARLPFHTLLGNDPETGASWSNCAQDRRRYGPLYSATSMSQFQRGYGDPLGGGVRQEPDTWITVTVKITVAAFGGAGNHITVWAAYDGFGYEKILDFSNVTLGSSSNYDTLWLQPYTTNRSTSGRKVTGIGGNIGGISVPICGPGTPLGTASLEYVASTGRLRFKSSADAYGTGRFFSRLNGVRILNVESASHGVATTLSSTVTLPVSSLAVASAASLPTSGTVVVGIPDTTNGTSPGSGGVGEQRVQYTGKSGNTLTGCTGGTGTHDAGVSVLFNSFVVVRLDNSGSLPASGTTTMNVTVADGRNDTQVNYADLIIKNNAEINAPGGFPPRLPTWVPGTIGAWVQISGTALSSVDPSPLPTLGSTGTQAKVSAWNGFPIDPRSSKMYSVCSGGHVDYSGNEVDVLELERDSPRWVQLLPPTLGVPTSGTLNYYGDGKPGSRHHFYGVVFSERTNKVMMFGGSLWYSGNFNNSVDHYDVKTNSLSASGDHPDLPGPDISVPDVLCACADTRTGDVYVFNQFAVGRWDCEANTCTEILAPTGGNAQGINGPTAYDSKRHRIFLAGGQYAVHHTYDITANAFTTQTFSGAQASTVQNASAGSQLVYVPALDKYLMLPAPGDGGTVYQIDASTFACTTFSTSGGSSIPTVANNDNTNPNGPYGKFQYAPRLGGCIFVPRHNQNAWFLRVH